MNKFIMKTIWKYIALIFVLLFAVTLLLFPNASNPYLLFAVILILFVILSLSVTAVFMKYIQPIEKANHTMGKILQGNYHARIHDQSDGIIGDLNYKINALARSLSKLKIQEQLQAEQLTTVLENTNSGLVLIDEKGYIHVVNKQVVNMFGFKEQTYIGELYYDVISEKTIHEAVQKTFLHETIVKKRFSIKKNNEKTYIEVVSAPIFNEFNVLKGAVLAIYDISEFKRLDLMRKDFVANVSHELKTPITSIRGFAETLLHNHVEDEEMQEQFLSIIFEESKRIHTLIDDLLILSQLERDTFQLDKSEFQLNEMVMNIHKMMDIQAKEKEIELKVNIEGNINMYADQQKLKQIIINLLSNAISYTAEKGIVNLKVKQREDDVSFEITDTGIGIAKEDIPRLFERFYRVDKARSRDTGGTGLGLAIVKHIVEQHEGYIEVTSELGKGTTFTIFIPNKMM